MSRRTAPFLLCCALLAVACANPEGVTGKKPDGGGTLLIRLQNDTAAAADTLLTGDEHWLLVDAVDTTTTDPITWSIADTTIVRIVAQNRALVRVRAVKIGKTTITAQHGSETGTFPLVVRDLLPSDTIPRVAITLALDSLIIGDSLPFGFDLVNRKYEDFFDLPYTITLSDSSVVRLISMGDIHSYWIEGKKVGETYLKVTCACIGDSMRIRVHEPPATVPDPRASRYEAIDLGTFGGASAFPVAMNDSGDVVGYSLTADGEQHAFLWANGVMQDLSPSGAHSAAQVITNSRVIAGTSVIAGIVHIVRWDNGQMTDLGPVRATDRHAGVVGITGIDLVAWGDSGSAIWQNGVKQFLGGFRARAMNSRHQIAGNVGDRPYLWDDGLLRSLETPGVPSHAVDINSEGAVLGDTPQESFYWGVRPAITVWVSGRISKTLGFIDPVALNDVGDVIGGVGSGAFYSHDGSPWYIPPLGGGWTVPLDLNDRGVVVGESWTVAKKRHAFVWNKSDDPPIDLGTGPITADRTGSSAIAINARGDIVGWVAPCTTPSGRCTDLVQTQARAILWRLKN